MFDANALILWQDSFTDKVQGYIMSSLHECLTYSDCKPFIEKQLVSILCNAKPRRIAWHKQQSAAVSLTHPVAPASCHHRCKGHCECTARDVANNNALVCRLCPPRGIDQVKDKDVGQGSSMPRQQHAKPCP